MNRQAGSARRRLHTSTSSLAAVAGSSLTGTGRTSEFFTGRSARSIALVTLFMLVLLLGAVAVMPATAAAYNDYTVSGVAFDWQTVVNNGVTAPGDTRTFNSYNQPSLNVGGLVVFRGRTKGGMMGGGEPTHGVFTRDMASGGPVVKAFDRTTAVPRPNNLGATFIEPPSFPRIDMWSDTITSRGNHQPVWAYLLNGTETRAGTTGIYTDPFGSLITGMSNLGAVPDLSFFAVPGTDGVKFEVFPGAPSVTDGATVVFKGNFTDAAGTQTGVYYRDLTHAPAGGTSGARVIADTSTLIPGTKVRFGSTAPPSAAGRRAVFAGFDNEESPTKGGIYRASLTGSRPRLTPLAKIGAQVPGEKKGTVFNRLGEGVSYDGRFVAFWGAWGTATRTFVLRCPTEGNKERIAYCKSMYPHGFTTTVPVYQGIFVYDTVSDQLSAVAKTPKDFTDFVYWNFSGKVPGSGEGDTGEPARWRSASFVAVSGLVDGSLRDATFHAAFKARQGRVVNGAYVDPVDGIYLRKGPGSSPLATVVETGMDGSLVDPQAPLDPTTGQPAAVTEMGLERDGFRGDKLAVNVRMGAETSETGWAGIYLTTVPRLLE